MHGVRPGQAELVGYTEDEVWDHMLAPIQELQWTILPKGEPLCLIPLVPRCVPLDSSQGGGGRRKNSPRQARFQPGRGGDKWRGWEKKPPRPKKFPVGWGVLGTAVGVEKLHVSGAKLIAPD